MVRVRVRCISLKVQADASFTLYEDENVNYNYEKGAYSMICFEYDEDTRTLSVAERQGEFPGMLQERVFNVIPVSKDGVGKTQTVKYNGLSMKVTL